MLLREDVKCSATDCGGNAATAGDGDSGEMEENQAVRKCSNYF